MRLSKKGKDKNPRLYAYYAISLHHHRLLAAVREDDYKPSVVVDGDAVNSGAKTVVAPFGDDLHFSLIISKY